MKKIALVLLSVIFVLVTGSIHYISAYDSTDSQGPELIVTTEDSKYQLHTVSYTHLTLPTNREV